ncbi:MAG: polysaccharide biosynthesis tyrosine autokinase [Aestuariivita sp.]|uniref:polysaccharide biosynthesis tyrosine autokinase n=1 Tax=Aestuariivita sp. TaxID=1872407 RepID=UPI003BB210EB
MPRWLGSEQTQAAPQADDDEIDLGALLSTLWRGKWLIALCMTVAILVGGYYAYGMATPLYRSTAVVILETNQDQIVDLQSVATGLSGDTTEINSEIEILRSRGLMGKVVDRLNLTEDPEFNGALRPPGVRQNAQAWVRSTLGLTSPPMDIPAEEKARQDRDRTISALIEKISVSNIRNSLVFNITATTEQPRKSALIADTLVELYIFNQIEVKFEAMEQATVWLTDRVSELQTSLEVAEARAAEFSAATDLVSVEGLRALERQTKEQRDRIQTAQMNRAAQAANLAALEAADTRALRAELADDPQLTRFLARADSDEAIGSAFDLRFDFVLERARQNLVRADQQLEALNASALDLEAQIASQGEDLITLQQLTREAEAIRTLYEYFLTRLNETSAQQGIQQADSRVLSNAVIPLAPSEPRKSMIVALSAILGIMLGAGIVLLRELRNNSFRTAQELEAATGYTVLGQIPEMPVSKRNMLINYLTDKPSSAAVEAVRNLRTSLMLSNVDQPPKIILSTSSVPGEGKTTNALSLAHNLLGLGSRVLLVEGDIRRRTLHEYFNDMPEKGIVSVLSGEKTLDEAIHRTPGFGADILGGEKSAVNAADLFASDRFKALIEEMRTKYDAVIIDTPPVLVVPDARLIAQSADAVIFTVRWDSTSKDQVEESMRMFHNSNQRLSGLVLGQISPKGMKRYGYGGKYGAYSAYGSKYYTN